MMESPQSQTRKSIIIDTDAGVDDAMAILLALLSPKECKVEAITTVCGNVPLDQATENVFRFLDIFQKATKDKDSTYHPLPLVFKGESQPLRRALNTATHVHGSDGLGGSTLVKDDKGVFLYPRPESTLQSQIASDAILDLASSRPGEITLITLGPLTNVARAAQKDAEKLKNLKEIYIMGGAFETYGNVSLAAEFNIWCDPDALAVVLATGIKVTMVPLDVTEKVWLDMSMVDPFLESNLLARYIRDICENGIFAYKKRMGATSNGLHMHDPLTVALVLNSEIIPDNYRKSALILVETEGTHTSGETLAGLRKAPTRDVDRAPHHHTVCLQVYADRFLQYFAKRLLKLDALS